jgi:hypothetical protein
MLLIVEMIMSFTIVPIGYLSVVVCATIPDWTCVGRFIGVTIDYNSIANAKSQRKSYFFSAQTNPTGQIKGRKSVYFFDSEPKTSAENCGGSDLSHNPRNPNISAL